MTTHKTGVVLSPIKYKNWQAEYVGDSTDTRGVYVFLRSVDYCKPIVFWELCSDQIELVLRHQKITILWEGDYTISSFLDTCNLTKKFAKKIIDNFYTQTESEMVFNLTQLDFNFDLSLVTLAYYVEQENYPDIVFSFEQLECLLLEYLTQ